MKNFLGNLLIRIMDYKTYLCQMKRVNPFLLGLFFISFSCSQHSMTLEKVDAKASWFKAPKRFTFKDHESSTITHPFFDLVPFANTKDNSINVVMSTMKGADDAHELDLISGKLYKKHGYCEQDDVWKKYEGEIYKPPFSTSFAPRLLDQLGTPQKVIVFGDNKYFPEPDIYNLHSQRVRIVGGYVEQYCKNYPCQSRESWLSRLVLIAVNTEDPEFKDIYHINELKRIVEWDHVKAFVENGNGRTIGVKANLPVYRMVGHIGPKDALRFAVKRGHLFKYKTIKQMKNSCHALYDYIWNSVQNIRNNNRPKKKSGLAKSSRPQVDFTIPSFMRRSNVISEKSKNRESNKLSNEKKVIEKKDKHFNYFMRDFYENYRSRFNTCQKFVRSSSINDSMERHWFFVLFSGYFTLESLNYFYNCPAKSWVENPRLSNGQYKYDPTREIYRCSSRELDSAFDSAITILTARSRSNLDHYFYVQYDDIDGGSHQKIYSWIYDNGKRLQCDKKVASRKDPFPTDVNWKPFVDKKTIRSGYIK